MKLPVGPDPISGPFRPALVSVLKVAPRDEQILARIG